MSQRSSLNDLKAGDPVAIIIGGHVDGSGLNRGTVVRVTKTQLVVTYTSRHHEMKFRKADGRLVGCTDIWHSTTIEPWTEDHEALIRSRDRTFKVKQIADFIVKHAHLVTVVEEHELNRIRMNLEERTQEQAQRD